MRWRRQVLLAFGLLLLSITTFTWWADRPRRAPISLVFLGFTNQPLRVQMTGRSPLMRQSPITITIPSALVLARNEGVGTVMLLHPGHALSSQWEADFARLSANGLPKVLKPGEACVIQAYPKGTTPWGTGVSYQPYGRLERLQNWLLKSGKTRALAWLDRLHSTPGPVFVSSGPITNCPPARIQAWPALSKLYPSPSLRDGGFYQ